MRNYEVTFIVDPVLSSDEIKATAQTYSDLLEKAGAKIVHVDEMGLRTLAYPINKRNSGIYYCIEFTIENGEFLDDFELAMRRDERIMRFLTVTLDKFGVKYNEDKRNGLIAKAKKPKSKKDRNDRGDRRRGGRDDRGNRGNRDDRRRNESAPKKEEAPKKEAAVATKEKPAKEEEE